MQNVDNWPSNVNNPSPQAVWEECLGLIRSNINPQSFQTWFLPITPLRIEGNRLIVQVPSQFFYEWIEEHYPQIIRNALVQVLGEGSAPGYVILKKDAEKPLVEIIKRNPGGYTGEETHLNSRYTFDQFVEGKGNQFARAAALAVAESPGKTSFNPLVLYSGVGLGKTHLIQAIGNFARAKGTAKRILYVSSEKFTIEFISAIQNNRMHEFSPIYRNVDILLVDDIQFLMSKERTQEEFFHTFNTLHQKGKQIVLSSDRPPKDLHGLEERLVSRFQCGLIADIQPPDLETRIAILQQKAQADEIDLPMEIIEYMASNITSNIRELEGALIKLLAFSSLRGQDIDMTLVKQVLKDIVIMAKRDVSIEQIQRVVCQYFHIPDDLLRGKSRKKEIASARMVAMFLAKEFTRYSLKSIGLHFGGRDHTTVIHAVRQIDAEIKSGDDNGRMKDAIDILKKKIEMETL